MRTAPTVVAVLVGALLVSLLAAGGAAAGSADTAGVSSQQLEPCAADSPANFTTPSGGDALGYVDGYWYDQPIVIGQDDGSGDTNETGGTTNETDSGANETNGESGAKGTNGESGANETNGESGAKGTNGESGANETNGESGANGTNETDSETDETDGTSGAEETGGANETGSDVDGTDGEMDETDGGNVTDDGNEADDANSTSSDGGTATDSENATTTGTPTNGTDGNESDGDGSESASEGRVLDASDGLDDRELEAVLARTAARVETQRCLSFESVPDVRVANRSTIRAEQRDAIEGRSGDAEAFDDGRLAVSMILGTETGTTEARAMATASSTRGFYDSTREEIVLVAEDDRTRVHEPTLAHELVHALQDQHFDLDRFDAALTDEANAQTGLIEGDASLVERRYEQRCETGAWGTDCLDASTATTGNSEFVALELFFFEPYNDGARYTESLYEEGGWDAVDARFDGVPSSSKVLLSPETPADFEPANVTFEAGVNSSWTRIDPRGRPDYDVLGPGTIGAAMLGPTFNPEVDDIYGGQHVTNNVDQSTLHPLYPYDYGIDAATGWDGDRLEVYRGPDDGTAVRWRTEWESTEAAATFRDRYVELLAAKGDASPAEYVGAYHFSDDSSFDGSVSALRDGNSVVVVHGPDLDALRALDDGAATDRREGSASSQSWSQPSREAADDGASGHGALGAVGAVLAALVLFAWFVVRRR